MVKIFDLLSDAKARHLLRVGVRGMRLSGKVPVADGGGAWLSSAAADPRASARRGRPGGAAPLEGRQKEALATLHDPLLLLFIKNSSCLMWLYHEQKS